MRASVIHLALFAAVAAFADAEMPFVTAEGRLAGAYQDNVDAAFVCLVLERDGGLTYAFMKTNDTSRVLKDIQPLVGRNVSVTGGERIPDPLNRAVTKRQIMVQSLADVRIAPGEAEDPFDAPPIGGVPPPLDELAAPTPRKACGTVTARWQNKVMLQTASGESLIAELRDGIDLPDIGESVEAAGTPVTDLYRIHLAEAVWRKSSEPPAKPESPSTVTLEMLFKSKSGGEFIMNPKFFGHTLKVTGALREFVTDEDGGKRLLLENGGHTIQIDCSNAPDASKAELGSQISATGVCVLDSDFWRPTLPFPKNNSLFLVARSPDDIVVLKRPP